MATAVVPGAPRLKQRRPVAPKRRNGAQMTGCSFLNRRGYPIRAELWSDPTAVFPTPTSPPGTT